MAHADTYVTLRITRPEMSVAEVTARLGIEPTHAHEAGDPRPRSGVYPHALWSLTTQAQGAGPLGDHLGALLRRVEPVRDTLVAMAAEGYEMDWFCFVSVDGNGGVVLDVDLLRRLADLPIELNLDIYG